MLRKGCGHAREARKTSPLITAGSHRVCPVWLRNLQLSADVFSLRGHVPGAVAQHRQKKAPIGTKRPTQRPPQSALGGGVVVLGVFEGVLPGLVGGSGLELRFVAAFETRTRRSGIRQIQELSSHQRRNMKLWSQAAGLENQHHPV